jgi:hypothetical protein
MWVSDPRASLRLDFTAEKYEEMGSSKIWTWIGVRSYGTIVYVRDSISTQQASAGHSNPTFAQQGRYLLQNDGEPNLLQ